MKLTLRSQQRLRTTLKSKETLRANFQERNSFLKGKGEGYSLKEIIHFVLKGETCLMT